MSGGMDSLSSFDFGSVDYLLIDLDGVIYRGARSLPGAADFIAWLRDRDIAFRLVTNNATLTAEQYAAKLSGMGIQALPDEVFTSALATGLHLRKVARPGQRALVIGEEGLVQAVHAAGLSVSDGAPERRDSHVGSGLDWVVVGLDRRLTYDKLASAALAIERGARFVGTNPDTSFPAEQGLVPGAGSILAALSATTGVQPEVIGKPQPHMLHLALESLHTTADRAAMLGDRLDTDIAGAAAVSMRSILVLTGVSRRDEIADSPTPPQLVVRDLPELQSLWAGALAGQEAS